MTHDARDDRVDEAIREAAQDYNRPPSVPREEMWARIQAARAASRAPVTPVTPMRPSRGWVWSAIGAAAVLMVGVGIGYRMRGSQPPPVATHTAPAGSEPSAVASRPSPDTEGSVAIPRDASEPAGERLAAATPRRRSDRVSPGATPSATDAGGDLAYRLAVVEHLARTEALLTSFRVEAKSGTVDAQVGAWARDLLRTTRLMEASAETQDPTMRRLLGDLELVLLQIAQYSGAASEAQSREELDLIEHSIERRGVITNLRAAIPPGMIPAGT